MPRIRTAAATFASCVALVAATASPAGAQESATDQVRVIHITVDSLHPDEVGDTTPTLAALAASGTWYEQARAIMASETLPNHVSMGTGTYAGRNGIPGNDGVADPAAVESADPDLGIPSLREAHSSFAAIEAECPDLRTVGVFSKEYVWRTFSEDPTDAYFDQPSFNIPVSGHAPEAATVPFILQELTGDTPPDFLFANLGDVDRTGHVGPLSLSGVPIERRAVITQTDTALGLIVQTLQDQGLWESTVLIISSDHSMDYSNPADPSTRVDVVGALEADERTAGRFLVSENGGAGFVHLLDPEADDRDQVLADARGIVAAIPGAAEALYRRPNPLEPGADLSSVHPAWNLHQTARAGDIVVYAEDGHAIGSQTSNPLPGNHGHGVTRHATALIAGGWDGIVTQSIAPSDPDAVDPVDDTDALPEQAEQVDYAPTFGWLLGFSDPATTIDDDPDGQWQGRVLEEAFSRRPTPRCGAVPTATSTTTTTATTAAPPAPPSDDRLPATGSTVPIAAGAAALGLFLIVRRGQRWSGGSQTAGRG